MKEVLVLEGHRSAVRAMHWEPTNEYLFTGADDKLVVAWAIGARKGERFELRGHRMALKDITFHTGSNRLFTADSQNVFVWDMSEGRKANPVWKQSDTCQTCEVPFLWNVKKIWEDKDFVPKRQHHCRMCGAAVCEDCCHGFVNLTTMGYELRVRVCKGCNPKLTGADSVKRCQVFEFKESAHEVKFVQLAHGSGLVRCESDIAVKLEEFEVNKNVRVNVWDVEGLAEASGLTVEAHHEKNKVAAVVDTWWSSTIDKMKAMMNGEETKREDNDADRPVAQAPGSGGAKPQVYQLGGDSGGDGRRDLLAELDE